MATFSERIRLIVEADGTSKVSKDFNQLDKDLTSSGKSVDGWKGKVGQASSFLSANMVPVLAGAGAAVGAFAVKAVSDFQDTALAAGKLADATGLAAEDASRWQEVAGDLGISNESLSRSFGFLLKSIGQNPDKFRELGITAKDSTGQIQQALAVLNATPEGAERAALGAQLFGRSWQEMSELIGMGAEEINRSLAAVSDAKVIDEGEVAKARQFRATLDQLNDVVQDATLTFGQFVLDGVGPTLQALGELGTKINSLSSLVGGGGGIFGKILGNLPGVGSIDGLNVALDGSADNIDRLKGAATAVLPPLKALPFGLFDTESSAEKAARKLQELTDAAENVNQGFDPASRAAAGFIGDMTEAELAAAKTAAAQRGLADAAKHLAEKEQEAAEAARAQADALEKVNDAAQTQLDAFLTLPDAIDEQAEAFSDLAKATSDFNKQPTAENLANVEERAKALAKADTDLAKAQAQVNNQQFTAADALDVTNSSLLKQASTMQGPAKQAIIDRIAALNGIPATKLTEVLARIPAGDIPAMEAALRNVSRARDAAIRAEATNVGYTEQQLANLARNRRAIIHVATSTTGTGGLTGGGQATGGSVQGGVSYMVGERGREMFVPSTDGFILNASDTARALAAGGDGASVGGTQGNTIINVTVTSADPQKVMDALDQYVRSQGSRRLQRLVA